jgi:thymidylate synthase
MRILAIVSGEYGHRHTNNIQVNGPNHWQIYRWNAPQVLPPVIDYPEDYLPKELPEVELILSFAENKGVAELLPDIAQMTKAKAVIAPVDSEAWLPRGLARQLRVWLERIGVSCATPKPLCSLTEHDYGVTRRERNTYDSPIISEFAKFFGQPEFAVEVDPKSRIITSVEVKRDAVCGCARYVAEKLIGISSNEAEEKAGLAHHHYPCLASMGIDSDFGDTLMHISGNILRDKIGEQVKPFKEIQYIRPGTKSD